MTTPTTYTFSKSPVPVDSLTAQIQANAMITVALQTVNFVAPNTLQVTFKDALPDDSTAVASTTCQTAALSAVVAAHDGTPLASTQALNSEGIPLVEVTPRLGPSGSHGTSIATHDFSKPHTWYQKSAQYVGETLTDSGDGLTFTSAHPKWIHIDQMVGGGFWEKKGLPKRDGSMGYHTDYAVTVKVDGATASPSTYTINPAAGSITFTSSKAGHVVTATYWSIDGVTKASEWILLAPAGTKYYVESAKVLCSINPTMPSPLCFEVWGSGLPNNYTATLDAGFPDAEINTPYCGKRDIYRNLMDFAINCNTVNVVGDGADGGIGGGFTKPFAIYTWDYVQVFFIDSAKGIVFRSYLVSEDPAITDTDIAIGAFFLQSMPTS